MTLMLHGGWGGVGWGCGGIMTLMLHEGYGDVDITWGSP